MTPNERVKFLLGKLGFNTQKDFADSINIKSGSLSDILRKRVGVSSAIKDRLALIHHVSKLWLETGEGPVFNEQPTRPVTEKEGIPYYDIDIEELASENLQMMEREPIYYVNYKPFNDCSAYLPVFGNSMHPAYSAGDIIAVKEIWNRDVLVWGEAYLIITNKKANDLRCIRFLQEHPDPAKVILRSCNAAHGQDVTIDRDSIAALYIIKGKITRNLI
ncbi:DNA-binding protein [Pedobacter yulinensis]|uniref:DNA-binding protein n=1 Tax=Pedobacter yulinensis TaxID=2126353 RepID=A0A2T3HHK4_9SPHI|nr:S24 family peptidase [Pedobacter yulinensis]PST81883.1 DNA-binding protein [Pedobacter yulinensis]